MTEATEPKVPAVITAIQSILGKMSVDKNGTLPGNMGGKPYITAVDASAETKRQFVAEKLVIIPNEHVIRHEVINNNNRLTVAIVIEGSYTIISSIDGSNVTVGGVGDGLAIGTAVASNIASTNALKNALLRTFLITEQSVEDAAKDGVPEEKPAAKKTEAQIKKESSAAELQTQIAAKVEASNVYDFEVVNALGDEISGKPRKTWFSNPTDLQKVLDAIEKGQLPA